jgi:hypothetical protein
MNTVLLTNTGDLIHQGRNATDQALGLLNHAVTLEDHQVLRSYFRLLENCPVLTQLNRFFPACLDQYRACPGDNCCTADFHHLEFSKSVEMIGYPGAPRLEIFTSLRGVPDGRSVSIQHQPLQCLLDMPLRLGKLRHVIFGDRMDLFEFDTVFNLFEFIDGIAWELSFQNLPQTCAIRR